MRTADAFLRHLLSAIDRALVWAVLAVVLSTLTWIAAWTRGFGLPALDGWRALGLALVGLDSNRTTLTLLALCVVIGVTCTTLIGGWLFRRWQRRSEVDVTRLRGARWEDGQ